MLFYFLLFLSTLIENRIFFSHNVFWSWFPIHTFPKFLLISPSIQMFHFCISLPQNWTKKRNSIKSPREGARNRDPFTHFRIPLKTLNWKPYMHRGPSPDPCRLCAGCFSLCAHLSFAHLDLNGLEFLMSSIYSGSYTLTAFSYPGFPELWGEVWWKHPI